MFHGQSLYQELTRVPLILRYPERVPAGTEVKETVALVDLLPTLLDLSGIAVPKAAQGRSLAPLLGPAGATARDGWRPRPVFSERPFATHFGTPPPHDTESYAVVDGRWKLVWNVRRRAGAPEHELYDRRRDPRETNDVAARHPREVP
jgi:arylsulfatase A-like enzyme